MNQLIVQHVHGQSPSFRIIRPDPFKDVPASADIVAPADFAVDGIANSNLAQQLRWMLEQFLEYPFSPRTEQSAAVVEALRKWGMDAFNSLFSTSAARDFYIGAVSKGFENLQLTIRANDARILSWPWESLFDPERRFIGQYCQIERQLTEKVADPPPLHENLPRDRVNILLVTCRPYGQDVSYRSISRSLVDLVYGRDLPAEVTVLRPPTLAQLDRVLTQQPGYFHLVHFDGYGAYGPRSGTGSEQGGPLQDRHRFVSREGSLIFESADGNPDPVPAPRLTQLLLTHRIPAMVLNACQAAMFDESADGAFASVATALLQAGVRSVVAMSYSLYVSGAQRFLPAFYETLFRTGDFAQATLGGRRAMMIDMGRVCVRGRYPLNDWLVPVLYQQQPLDFSFARTGGQDIARLPPQSRLPTEARDAENPYGFIGRDSTVLTLERALHRRVPAMLVQGLGGAGKTTVARGFAEWLDKTNGLDRCFWFSFNDIHSAEFVLNRIGEAVNGPNFIACIGSA